MTRRYTISSDFIRKNFTNTLLTFSVEHMKADSLLMVRCVIEFYTSGKSLINRRKSKWWVVGDKYQGNSQTFNITETGLNRTAYIKVGFEVDGLSEDNRFYFNHIQLAEGRIKDYHQPESAIPKTSIKFSNNFSCHKFHIRN